MTLFFCDSELDSGSFQKFSEFDLLIVSLKLRPSEILWFNLIVIPGNDPDPPASGQDDFHLGI